MKLPQLLIYTSVLSLLVACSGPKVPQTGQLGPEIPDTRPQDTAGDIRGLHREKGKGTVSYSSIFGVSVAEKRVARDKAIINSIDRWAQKQGKSRYENLRKYGVLQIIEKSPETYATNITKIGEDTDKKTKTYNITVETQINASKINAVLEDQISVASRNTGRTPAATSLDDFLISSVFVTKELASQEEFKDRESEFTDEQKETFAKETLRVDPKGTEVENKVNKSETVLKEKGGSVLYRNADQIFRVDTAAEVDAAVTQVFTEAKYEVFEAGDIEIPVDRFKAEFGRDVDVSPALKRDAYKVCSEDGINFFAIGLLELGRNEKDKVTGQTTITATVTSKVYQLRKLKSGKIVGVAKASISGKPYIGFGPNILAAKANVRNKAAKESAIVLVEQLRAKGLVP